MSLTFIIFYPISIYSGLYSLSFIKPTFDSWHSFLQWKYEDGYLVNLGLDQVLTLTANSQSAIIKEKDSQSRTWTLDYNGNINLAGNLST